MLNSFPSTPYAKNALFFFFCTLKYFYKIHWSNIHWENLNTETDTSENNSPIGFWTLTLSGFWQLYHVRGRYLGSMLFSFGDRGMHTEPEQCIQAGILANNPPNLCVRAFFFLPKLDGYDTPLFLFCHPSFDKTKEDICFLKFPYLMYPKRDK